MPLSVIDSVQLSVKNIGGIAEPSIPFSPCVTILAGRNPTNRTSLLQVLMPRLGSEDVSLREDVDKGYVELTFGDEAYFWTLTRTNGGTYAEGDAYLDNTQNIIIYEYFSSISRSKYLSRDLKPSPSGGIDVKVNTMRRASPAES